MPPKVSISNILNMVYYHVKTSDGGDLYMTRFAKPFRRHLSIRNWFEKKWFERHRTKLQGTSTVYKVRTRKVLGVSHDLVVKYCRVGEDVPLNTHTLEEFYNAEFNSPWEEFQLVSEMREGSFGPRELRLSTQKPLAIYVPPEKMQVWQSGRSRSRIRKIISRHPGIALDILKQYILIYAWIPGRDVTEIFDAIGMERPDAALHLAEINHMVMNDMEKKGYYVADMKPQHIIIGREDVERLASPDSGEAAARVEALYHLVKQGKYSIIDYELLFRTPVHEQTVKASRRHIYLIDQRDRFTSTSMPPHLTQMEIFGVPYVYGYTESTGGRLWVVGRNAELFDFFLPERWRKTPYLSLSKRREVYYTITKDNIHIVWKTSRVGELPSGIDNSEHRMKAMQRGINSLFEKVAISEDLKSQGISTVYIRALYMTGSRKLEGVQDRSRYASHADLRDAQDNPILLEDHNYIIITGYFNGYDEWVPEHEGELYRPYNLEDAVAEGLITAAQMDKLLLRTIGKLWEAGYDGTLLSARDLIIAADGKRNLLRRADGELDAVICNLELIWKLG